MLATNVSLKLQNEFGSQARDAFEALCANMNVITSDALSTEAFMVAFIRVVADAESALPDNLKQNNFGYSIGEGGNYRATIKAVVTNTPTVIG